MQQFQKSNSTITVTAKVSTCDYSTSPNLQSVSLLRYQQLFIPQVHLYNHCHCYSINMQQLHKFNSTITANATVSTANNSTSYSSTTATATLSTWNYSTSPTLQSLSLLQYQQLTSPKIQLYNHCHCYRINMQQLPQVKFYNHYHCYSINIQQIHKSNSKITAKLQ
jgi:hypothetical protein